MCPDCGSENVRIEEYDFGVGRETGYHDAGELYRCLTCGAVGDAAEIVMFRDGSGGSGCIGIAGLQ
ncbi:MAG: hypothetical protein ACKV22_39275 [Bryobacteraceae bacterium]